MKSTLQLAVIFAFAMTSIATAGTLTVTPFTGDADSGISTAKKYTQKVDFATGNNNVINGVQFLGSGSFGPNHTVNVTDTFNNFDSPVANDQAIENLLRDFYYRGDAGPETLTLTGLQPGVQYRTSLYVAGFAGNTQVLAANDTTPATVTGAFDRGTVTGGARIDYDFVLPVGQSSLSLLFTPQAPVGSFHQYGFSTEEVAYTLPAGYSSLTGISSTGVGAPNSADGTNATQITTTGVLDTHWQVDIPSTPGLSFQQALTATNQGAYFNGGGNSSFINELGNAAINSEAGVFTYRTTFNIAANLDPNSVILTGRIFVDNEVTDVLINGQSTLVTGDGFNEQSGKWFVIQDDFFVTGLNTVDFLVLNEGVDPSGLRVDNFRAIAVPEPGTFLIFGVGVVGLLTKMRRRIRTKIGSNR